MMFAAYGDHVEALQMLIRAGADLTLKSKACVELALRRVRSP